MHPNRRLNSAESRFAQQLAGQVRKALTIILTPGEDADQTPLRIERAEQATAPARLAAGQPGGDAARQKMQSVYADCLVWYREHMQRYDATDDDVGAAMAAFVSACMGAMQGVQSAPGYRPGMDRQLSNVLRRHPLWTRANAAERQTMFERFAILAVFVQGCAVRAVREGPKAVANVRQAGRSYLRELFGIDPDMLALGPCGLRVKD
jgi:hypothetical protein